MTEPTMSKHDDDAADQLRADFLAQLAHLRRSGAIGDNTPLAIVYGVAIENLADSYLTNRLRKHHDYSNLKAI